MRIAVDARAAAEEPAGGGRFVRELLLALAASEVPHELLLLARRRWEDAPDDPRHTWRLNGLPDPVWHVHAAAVASRSCDVALCTNSYLSAWFLRVPAVVCVYDLIAYRPELLPQARARRIEMATLPLAVRRAASLLCISAATASDLVARFPAAAGRTRVAPLAAAERFAPEGPPPGPVLARHGLDRPYVLGVGTLEPRKNLPRLIEAFAGLGEDVRGDTVLALVGPTGWDTGATRAAIEAHPGLVRPLGHVGEDDLGALYRGATLFAYPSLFEAFGLPVLEAMRCAVPVVTSATPALLEVTGDAAVHVDPLDVASIADGLARALADPALRERLAAAGRAHAEGFSWGRTAAAVVSALEEAHALRRR